MRHMLTLKLYHLDWLNTNRINWNYGGKDSGSLSSKNYRHFTLTQNIEHVNLSIIYSFN